jgi:hypothetical protein
MLLEVCALLRFGDVLRLGSPEGRTTMAGSFLKASCVGGFALLAMGIAFPTAGHADVFTITQDNIGVNCAAGCGTVTVTEAVVGGGISNYTFDVDLSSALVLHQTPGAPATVGFNLAGTTALVSSNSAGSTLSSGVPMDGFGNFLFGVDCGTQSPGNICIPNGQSPLADFIFTVSAPSGEHLTLNSQGFPLALDVAQASSISNTGFASVPGPVIGAGWPGLVMASGALVALARRRRQKFA